MDGHRLTARGRRPREQHGIAFAALYSTLAIPFARYADRGRRVSVISAAVAVWSLFTALCGAAGNFWQLFAARMGVGIGEAGGVAPSYALIADYFTPQRRARALAIFSLGIPIGSAIGLYFGGWIATVLNWRWAFVLIGLAAVGAGKTLGFGERWAQTSLVQRYTWLA